jgi:membrane protein DedA with SNARE-associated domain
LFDDIFNHVHDAVAHYGYAAVALGILLEHFGLPTPGETLLISGSIAASRGILNIYVLLPLAWLAGTVGNTVGYWIGLNGGHRLLLYYGGRIGITADRLKRVEGLFAHFGNFVIVFARFVPVLRQFSGIVAGTLEMPLWRFTVLNAVGCALWVGFWGGLTFWLGKRFYTFINEFTGYKLMIYVVIGAAIIIALGYFVWRTWTNGKKPAPKTNG